MLHTIIIKLLEGGYIIPVTKMTGKASHKLYSGNMNPECWIADSIMNRLANDAIIKTTGAKADKRMYISRRAIQKLHGKDQIKIYYKQFLKQKSNANNS